MLTSLNNIITDYSRATLVNFNRGTGFGINNLFPRMTELSDFDATVGSGNKGSGTTTDNRKSDVTLENYQITKSTFVKTNNSGELYTVQFYL